MFNSSSFYNPHLLLTTDTPQEGPVELSIKEFLGVGQGACYWHGVGGSRRSIIISTSEEQKASFLLVRAAF